MLSRRVALLPSARTATLTSALVATLAATLTATAAPPAAEASARTDPPATVSHAAEPAGAVTSSRLTWKKCYDRRDEPGLPRTYYRQQCATLTVPEDWAVPTGPTIDIAVTRLLATHQPAKGVLFTNPGGPGAAGAELPLVFGDAGRKSLLRGQDVYGIDVRGAGDSDNATCGDAYPVATDPRDRSQPDLDLMLDSVSLVARACDVAGGTLIDHVDTAQTVRDLEQLRTLIKADTINWLGYSAGTWLGAQYTAAYPERVGHFVFDSTVDFTSDWQAAFELQPMGFQRRFDHDFVPWVARNNRAFRLGTTAAAVQASYERIRRSLDPRHSPESGADLDQLIAGALYSADLFPLAAFILASLDSNDQRGTSRAHLERVASLLRRSAPSTLFAPAHFTTAPGFSADSEDASFFAVTCNDTPWSIGRNGLAVTSERLGRAYPLIGWSTIYQPCAFWDRAPRSVPLLTPTGQGLPPTLFVQSEHDPATPIEGATRAAAAFPSSRMLVIKGGGDHAVYAGGNACVNAAVEKFLNSGALPRDGATCTAGRLPGPGALSASAVPGGSGGSGGSGVNPLVRLRRTAAALQPADRLR